MSTTHTPAEGTGFEVPHLRLHDGNTIPQLGFGVFQIPNEQTQQAVETALEVGYRHIDTAAIYGNEAGVGAAIRHLNRDELFITTKLWNDRHDDAADALAESLEKLGTDHVDLYLIHWPATKKYGDSYIRAWESLQELTAQGLATSIGVSNFQPHHLDALTGEVPAVNQVELHPTFQQAPLRELHAGKGIATEAWGPLGQGHDLDNPVIVDVARDLGVTPAQVIIRWHLEIGNIVIPKSVTPERIAANFAVSFTLSPKHLAALAGVDAGNRIGPVPSEADF
ncbi:MAG: aldo/keto reductase [Corynebacterium sp.]|nr:aldo/keto reductase [Corynebacterium sp.]